MTRDQIIALAREAGWNGIYSKPLMSIRMQEEDFLRFAELVAAHERGKCAHLVASQNRGNAVMSEDTRAVIKYCAKLIRSRCAKNKHRHSVV